MNVRSPRAPLPSQPLSNSLCWSVLLLSAFYGCQSARSARPEPAGRAASPVAAAPPAASRPSAKAAPELQTAPEAARRQQIDQVAGQLARLRGLRLLRPLKVQWVGPAAVRRFVREELARSLSDEQLDGYVATLAALGLLPASYALRQAMEELASEQVAGLYDPKSERLLIQEEMPAGEVVLAHEITHALQDQHFDLDRLEQAVRDNDDLEFARHALVEGDATLAMMVYLRQSLTVWKALRLALDLVQIATLDQAKLQAAPLYVRETLLRSYMDGMQFVQVLWAQGGWPAVDAAYASFPASSEQILHPDKYLQKEMPLAVTVPELPLLREQGFAALHANTLGELGVALFLRSGGISEGQAALGAAGWGGDRLQSYRAGERLLTIWRLRWDSPAEAGQFQRLLEQLLGRRYGARPAGQLLWRGPVGTAALALGPAEVTLLVGPSTTAQARAIARGLGLHLTAGRRSQR